MAGRRPWIKLYRTTKGQRIDYKNDEVGALWLNDGKNGKYLSGKLGKKDSNQVDVIGYMSDDEDGEGEQRGDEQQDGGHDGIPF